MLIADTVVDVGVGSGAFVGLVVDVERERTTIHMDGIIKIGSRVVIRSDDYRVNATAKSCSAFGDSFAISFDIDWDDSSENEFEWPQHARTLTTVG